MHTLTRSDGTTDPRECGGLAEAMAAAGHPDPADWIVVTGVPGAIYTGWAAEIRLGGGDGSDGDAGCQQGFWKIRARGAAHELIGQLTAAQIMARSWSEWDARIIHHAMTELSWPEQAARRCAARVAAHLAAEGGILTHDQIVAAIGWAYTGGDVLPGAEVINGAVRVGNALAAARFTIHRAPELAALSTRDIVPTRRHPGVVFPRA
jgi:hypothetical protein